ncbi:hypothetical protein APH_0155 [Anaplasma phagocytophilum str. HZ]|uniref:Uncharacterized protein n=2 Tax=Anaplasma phagocytophilum TaxID=948 RepID=A0A098EGQ8_ANAPH|nr:hypothetical protein APH_0155 [Anaplasma phagocytophilum str. HZ]CEG20987.1 Protein of unknown function [Anaplasma phagocytophilum]
MLGVLAVVGVSLSIVGFEYALVCRMLVLCG